MRRCWSSRSGWLKSSQIQSRQRPLKPPALVERRGELQEGLTFRLTAPRVRLTTPGKLRRSTSQPALSLWRGAAYLLCNHVCAAGFKLDASGCLVGLKKQSVSVWVWQESVLRRESHQTSDHRGIRLLFVHRQRNYRGDIIACVGALWVQSGHIRREGGAGPSFCLAIISLIKFWKPTLPTNQQLPVP